jgi:hypothetical protein
VRPPRLPLTEEEQAVLREALDALAAPVAA